MSPFSEPGESDLTANVDFAYLREAMDSLALSTSVPDESTSVEPSGLSNPEPSASPKVGSSARTLGPITQRDFLLRMGIGTRLNKLMEGVKDERQRNDILTAAERLVSPLGMGTQYKVMGVVPRRLEGEVYPFISVPDQREVQST